MNAAFLATWGHLFPRNGAKRCISAVLGTMGSRARSVRVKGARYSHLYRYCVPEAERRGHRATGNNRDSNMQVEQALIVAKSGDLDNLRKFNLSEEGVERFVDGRGATLAHYAARGGHVSALEYLAGQGVDASLRSGVGATPAHDAAATGNTEALVWVLKNTDCSVEDRDDGGCTVSHLCALYGHLRALKWLVSEGGASTVTKTKAGALPLHFAATNGDLDTVKFLVEQRPG